MTPRHHKTVSKNIAPHSGGHICSKQHGSNLRDWSLIIGGGYNMGNLRDQNFCTAPPTQDRVKLVAPPLLNGGHLLCPPSVWLKLQAPVLKLPQNLLCPLFQGFKLHLVPPPLQFCSPPFLPVIDDQSLTSRNTCV